MGTTYYEQMEINQRAISSDRLGIARWDGVGEGSLHLCLSPFWPSTYPKQEISIRS